MRRLVNRVSCKSTVIALVAGLLAPCAAISQLVPPTPLEQAESDPPTNGFNMPTEGWARVRYSVLADGTTANFRVMDRMPTQLADREIREAFDNWTFQPAMKDGTAVDWHNNESIIVFDAGSIPPEPSPRFVTGYREVDTLLTVGEHEDAEKRSRLLLSTETSRLAEMGVGLVQNARIHMALGNPHEAYAAIQRATDPRATLLEPSELAVALEYRNTLELGLGDVVGALATFARRTELGPVPDTDLMAARADAIEAALSSDAAIGVKGKMLEDVWTHNLARRTFAIGDLDGSLRRLNVECDQGQVELEYSEESEWSIPESWGACTVSVEGRRNTEFVFYEFQ